MNDTLDGMITPDNPFGHTPNETTTETQMRNHANGMTVLGKYKHTIFVRLPREISAPCHGGCVCDYCVKHSELTPMWDTLAISDDGRGHTWTVHMPEVPYHLMTKTSQK